MGGWVWGKGWDLGMEGGNKRGWELEVHGLGLGELHDRGNMGGE